MFEVVLSNQAEKFYDLANDKLKSQLNLSIDIISENPYLGNNIKLLKGSLGGLHRYRLGNYRIVYSIQEKIKIISIFWIGKRKDAYK
jgi:mRNA interferase RelE/StbE